MPKISNKKLVQQTQEVFKFWEDELFAASPYVDQYGFVLYTEHSEERLKERNITMGQIRYILKKLTEDCLEAIQTSTRKECFKLKVNGIDFDGQKITLIVIPDTAFKGIKLITCYYSD